MRVHTRHAVARSLLYACTESARSAQPGVHSVRTGVYALRQAGPGPLTYGRITAPARAPSGSHLPLRWSASHATVTVGPRTRDVGLRGLPAWHSTSASCSARLALHAHSMSMTDLLTDDAPRTRHTTRPRTVRREALNVRSVRRIYLSIVSYLYRSASGGAGRVRRCTVLRSAAAGVGVAVPCKPELPVPGADPDAWDTH
jgi:hypothetical protein